MRTKAKNKKRQNYVIQTKEVRSLTVLPLYPSKVEGVRKRFHILDYGKHEDCYKEKLNSEKYLKALGMMYIDAQKYLDELHLKHKKSNFHIIENVKRSQIKGEIHNVRRGGSI